MSDSIPRGMISRETERIFHSLVENARRKSFSFSFFPKERVRNPLVYLGFPLLLLFAHLFFILFERRKRRIFSLSQGSKIMLVDVFGWWGSSWSLLQLKLSLLLTSALTLIPPQTERRTKERKKADDDWDGLSERRDATSGWTTSTLFLFSFRSPARSLGRWRKDDRQTGKNSVTSILCIVETNRKAFLWHKLFISTSTNFFVLLHCRHKTWHDYNSRAWLRNWLMFFIDPDLASWLKRSSFKWLVRICSSLSLRRDEEVSFNAWRRKRPRGKKAKRANLISAPNC